MLKEKQMQVLQKLRTNARKPFTAISKETGIPVTTIFDYYAKLRKDIIKKQVCLLNFKNLGFHFNSFFS